MGQNTLTQNTPWLPPVEQTVEPLGGRTANLTWYGYISKWSYDLVQDTGAILLDGAIDKQTRLDIMTAIEADADNRITDLHIRYVAENRLATTISLVTHFPRSPEDYKSLLNEISFLTHVLVEVNQCQGEPLKLF